MTLYSNAPYPVVSAILYAVIGVVLTAAICFIVWLPLAL